jgi:hypothetical protein
LPLMWVVRLILQADGDWHYKHMGTDNIQDDKLMESDRIYTVLYSSIDPLSSCC